jgi:hypothetical protein
MFGMAVGPTIEDLVLILPPKERACVLLKDVFEYSLDEIAAPVDSTVGGVKAALNRGRSKLASSENSPAASRVPAPDNTKILQPVDSRRRVRHGARMSVAKCIASKPLPSCDRGAEGHALRCFILVPAGKPREARSYAWVYRGGSPGALGDVGSGLADCGHCRRER